MKNKNDRSVISIIKQLRKFKKSLSNPDSPEGLFKKCRRCDNLVSQDRLKSNYHTCPKCGYHFIISAKKNRFTAR